MKQIFISFLILGLIGCGNKDEPIKFDITEEGPILDHSYVSFTFQDPEYQEVMRVLNTGEVFWLKNGEMVKAEIDEDLAKAFHAVVQKQLESQVLKL